jgi:hypothetical protein
MRPNGAMGGGVATVVQTLYYVLGIVFMLGGAVAAYVKGPQGLIGKMEKALVEYKFYVAEPYPSQEFLTELKREIADSLRDLGSVPSQPGLTRQAVAPYVPGCLWHPPPRPCRAA